MSAQNSAGIQTLLDAEREASKIVQKGASVSPNPKMGLQLTILVASHSTRVPARNPVRTKRVREARDEAKKEIDAYKAEKESEYKQFESEHTQGNKAAEEEANKEAEAKIKEIRAAGQKNQDKVVQDLLKAVFEAKPEPPSEVAA